MLDSKAYAPTNLFLEIMNLYKKLINHSKFINKLVYTFGNVAILRHLISNNYFFCWLIRKLSIEREFKLNTSKILLLLCFLVGTTQAFAGQVDTTGFGLIKQNDLSKARQAAIEDAKRLALEQLLGSYISARTETKNFMLASEKIYATTKGRLDKFDILEESKLDDSTYQVKIRAYTDSNAVAKEAVKLIVQNKWNKKPRIKLKVNSLMQNSANAQASSAITANLAKSLSKEGFVVLNENSVLGASFDLVLNVSAVTNKGEFQGMSINTNEMSVSGSLLNGATLSQITSVSFADKLAGESAKSFSKIAEKLSKRVALKVSMQTKFAWLSKLENPILIAINDANAEQISAIENNLNQAVVGLSGVTTENRNQQEYLLSASYLGWPEQLYEQLNQLSKRSDIAFNVVGFDQSTLTLSIK